MEGIKKIAVLIDADNAQAEYLSQSIEEVKLYGDPILKWAFGDWTTPQLSSWKQYMASFAIKPLQSFAHSKGKNSTDISLVISAMEILYNYPYISGFCILSSDSDFTELVVKLKENNKFVLGIGKRQTPPAFVKACHKFKYTDDYNYTTPTVPIVPELPASSTIIAKEPKIILITPQKTTTTPPAGKSANKTDAKLILLKEAVTNTAEADGTAPLSKVVNELRRLAPRFSPKDYGHSNYIKIFKSLSTHFQVNKNDKSNYYIKIKR